MNGCSMLMVALSLLMAGTGANAQSVSNPDVPRRQISTSEVTGDSFEFTSELTLEVALERALMNNLGYARDRLNIDSARNAVARAEAAFDMRFNGGVTSYASRHARQITEEGLVTPDQETDNVSYSASLRKQLGTGTSLSLTTSASSLDSDFGLGPIARTANSRVSLQVTHPLLQNGGAAVNRAQLVSARALADAAEHDLGRSAMLLAVNIESAYWDLALAEQVEALRLESVVLARFLVDMTEAVIEVGRGSRLDLLEARNGLAAREQELIAARFERASLAEALQLDIGGRTDDLGAPLILTATGPIQGECVRELAELEALATASRRDLLSARERASSSEVNLAAARRNTLPRLDIVGTFATGGTADDLSAAYDRLADNQSPVWNVGVNFSMPFGNRAATANYLDAAISNRREAIGIQLLDNDIRLEVREAFRNLTSTLRQLEIAARNAGTAEELLEAASTRYRLGLIDSYRLLESEHNSTESAVALAQRRYEAAKSISRLRLAVGSTEAFRGEDCAAENGAGTE